LKVKLILDTLFIHVLYASLGKLLCIGLETENSLCSAKFENEIYFSELAVKLNFMVAPCISNIKHHIVQLMHTNYKILRLLK